jgi:hypothetical protein
MKLAPLYDCTNTDDDEYEPALNTGYNAFTSSLCKFNCTTNTDALVNDDKPTLCTNDPRYTEPPHDKRNTIGLVAKYTVATHTDCAFATLDELNHTDAAALIEVAFDDTLTQEPCPFFHNPPIELTFVTDD